MNSKLIKIDLHDHKCIVHKFEYDLMHASKPSFL